VILNFEKETSFDQVESEDEGAESEWPSCSPTTNSYVRDLDSTLDIPNFSYEVGSPFNYFPTRQDGWIQ
jgi:hypothetical protein